MSTKPELFAIAIPPLSSCLTRPSGGCLKAAARGPFSGRVGYHGTAGIWVWASIRLFPTIIGSAGGPIPDSEVCHDGHRRGLPLPSRALSNHGRADRDASLLVP